MQCDVADEVGASRPASRPPASPRSGKFARARSRPHASRSARRGELRARPRDGSLTHDPRQRRDDPDLFQQRSDGWIERRRWRDCWRGARRRRARDVRPTGARM